MPVLTDLLFCASYQILRMLDFAVEKGIESWIEKWEMGETDEALKAFEEKGPKYRYVLVNSEQGGRMRGG